MRRLFRELDGGISLYIGAPYKDTKGRVVIDLRFERENEAGRLDVLTTSLPSIQTEKNIGFSEDEEVSLIAFARSHMYGIQRASLDG